MPIKREKASQNDNSFVHLSVGSNRLEKPAARIYEMGMLNLHGYVRNNPVNSTDPLGLLDFFVFIEGDFVTGRGVEGGFGFVLDWDNFLDSGFFVTVSPTGGANAGGGNIGASWGGGFSLRELEGVSANIDFNIVFGSPTFSFDDAGFNGFSFGGGPGLGVSVSVTDTMTYTVRDFLKDISKIWNDL